MASIIKTKSPAIWIITILIAVIWVGQGMADSSEPEKKAVAMVNDVPILRDELDVRINIIRQRFTSQGRELPDDQIEVLKQSVLNSLVDQELLYQESKKAGIKIDPKEVADKIDEIKKNFPSESGFQEALKANNTTESKLKEHIERGIAIQTLIDERVAAKVNVPEADQKAFYDENPKMFLHPEQVRASHILIKVSPEADEKEKEAAKQKIDQIREKIGKGTDFAELASEFSEGPSKEKGGDLGYFGRGQMVEPFEKAVFALKPGETSDMVVTRFGYHLIRLVDHKPEKQIPFSEAQPKIMDHLKKTKTKEGASSLVEDLRKTANIKLML